MKRLNKSKTRKLKSNIQGISAVVEVAKANLFLDIKSSLWGDIVYHIFTGLFGTLLVALFLTGVMPLTATVKFIPWIIGFNAALTGYTLIDRNRDQIRHQKAAGAGAGFSVALAACIALNILTGYKTGVGLIYWTDMLFFIAIGMGFGGLGAVLSVKYSAIKKSQNY